VVEEAASGLDGVAETTDWCRRWLAGRREGLKQSQNRGSAVARCTAKRKGKERGEEGGGEKGDDSGGCVGWPAVARYRRYRGTKKEKKKERKGNAEHGQGKEEKKEDN